MSERSRRRLSQFGTKALTGVSLITLLALNSTFNPAPSSLNRTLAQTEPESRTLPGHTEKESRIYHELFPAYAEACSGSRLTYEGGVEGGKGGHALLYVHGLCKDYSRPYPALIPCDEASVLKPEQIHEGVGISVNNIFKNVNFVVVPGYDLFTFGEQSPDGEVNESAMQRIVDRSLNLGIFRGVEVYDIPGLDPSLRPEQKDYEKAVARDSIGTDIALRFGRELHCVRVPFPKERLSAIAEYLNERNRKYFFSKNAYEWSGFSNNCAHVVSQGLAAAGIREPIKDSLPWYRQIFNLALPENGVQTVQDIAHFQSHRLTVLLRDPKKVETLIKNQWVPGGLGALSFEQPQFSKNQIFDFGGRPLNLPNTYPKKTGDLLNNARKAFTSPEYSQLEANLQYWKGAHEKLLSNTLRAEKHFEKSQAEYEAYLAYSRKQIRLAEEGLKKR